MFEGDRLLTQGERVLLRTRRHPIVLLQSMAAALALVAMGALATAVVLELRRPHDPMSPWLWGGLAVVAFGVALATPAYLRWRCEQVLVTDRRVIQVAGVLEKRVLDSPIDQVNDVLLAQSLLGRALDYGSLEVLTTSAAGISRLEHLAHPLAFKHALLGAKGAEVLRAARRRAHPDSSVPA